MTTKQSRRNLVRRPMKRICNGALVFLIVLYTSTAANASPTMHNPAEKSRRSGLKEPAFRK